MPFSQRKVITGSIYYAARLFWRQIEDGDARSYRYIAHFRRSLMQPYELLDPVASGHPSHCLVFAQAREILDFRRADALFQVMFFPSSWKFCLAKSGMEHGESWKTRPENALSVPHMQKETSQV